MKHLLLTLTAFLLIGGLVSGEVCPVDEQASTKKQADDVEACMKAMRKLYYKCQSVGTVTDTRGEVIAYISLPVDEDCVDLDFDDLADNYRKSYRKLLYLNPRSRSFTDKVLPDEIYKPIRKKARGMSVPPVINPDRPR